MCKRECVRESECKRECACVRECEAGKGELCESEREREREEATRKEKSNSLFKRHRNKEHSYP